MRIGERDYWVGFSNFPGVGPIKFKKLLAEFGSAKEAWSAKQTELKEVLGEVLTTKFEIFRDKFSVEEYVGKLKRAKVWFLTLADKEYPQALKKINNPPFVLYGRILSELSV